MSSQEDSVSPEAAPAPASGAVHFNVVRDGRLRYAGELWEEKKDEIKQLYRDQNLPLREVIQVMRDRGFDASEKMYRARFKSWGWAKNKPRVSTALRRVEHGQIPRPSSPPTAPILRHQAAIIAGLVQCLPADLTTMAWSWGTGPYADSDAGRSVTDICQGNLLVQRGQHTGGFRMIHRGFSKLHAVFDQHTTHCLLDMIIHLQVYCDESIIQAVWRYLSSYSAVVLHRGHRIHEILERLRELSHQPEIHYGDAIRDTQIQVYEAFRQTNAFRDPSILGMMANGLKSRRTVAPWKDSDWVSFATEKLDDMRSSMRQTWGVAGVDYHKWLYRHIGGVRSLYGLDSEQAVALAVDIDREMEGIDCAEPRIAQECWVSMGQHHWKKWEETRDPLSPRAGMAISYLEKFVERSRELGLRNDHQLDWLQLLASWQRTAGRASDAEATMVHYATMVQQIEALPDPKAN
ncbi:hypothetical protein GQ53DRAFT_753098 [Thozetella sp. PMI_491]|nr:hypothetical protein GQ53DRAFT_753098 [Thozetella sp. PMI_491]